MTSFITAFQSQRKFYSSVRKSIQFPRFVSQASYKPSAYLSHTACCTGHIAAIDPSRTMYYDALTDFFQSGREVKTQFSPQKGLTNDAKSQSHTGTAVAGI